MKTFTKKLNREDIRDISLRLPLRSKWQDDDFDTVRKAIRAEYGIGSREFSSAVNYILNVHDFSTSIGIEHKPLGLSEDELLKFSDIWGMKNDIDEWRNDLLRRLSYDKNNDGSFITYNVFESTAERVERILISSEKYKVAFDELIRYATPRNISGLAALFEYKGCLFSEEYVEYYNSHLSRLKRCFEKGGDEWTSAVDELWDELLKNNHSLKVIILALRKLNMASYAHAIEKHCMVDGLIP